jgi:hypothetical protein
MVRDQRVERGEPRRSLDDPVRRAALAERADHVVDLLDRLPCHLLDRLQGEERAVGVLVVPQPGCAGADGDHADRVAGGVVEIAGDPGALLGGGEQALALHLPLGAQGAFSELGQLLAPQARSLASEPGDGPRETGMEGFDSEKGPLRGGGCAQVRHEQPDHAGRAAYGALVVVDAATPARPRRANRSVGRHHRRAMGAVGSATVVLAPADDGNRASGHR